MNQTPLEEQRQSALDHYKQLSEMASSHSSFVVAAIKSYKPGAVEEVDKWISVEDRLPEQPKGKDVKYLTYPNFEVLPFWSGIFWRYSNYTDSHIAEKQITHWQPLPSAPKQDKQK